MKIFVIILKKYSFKWNEKIFIRSLTNKKDVYSNEYFHSWVFYSFIRILGVFIGYTKYKRDKKRLVIEKYSIEVTKICFENSKREKVNFFSYESNSLEKTCPIDIAW